MRTWCEIRNFASQKFRMTTATNSKIVKQDRSLKM